MLTPQEKASLARILIEELDSLPPAEDEMSEAALFYDAASVGLGEDFLVDIQQRSKAVISRIAETAFRIGLSALFRPAARLINPIRRGC